MSAVVDFFRAKPLRGVWAGLGVVALVYVFTQAANLKEFEQFTVLGIAIGCIYAIAASGLVLTYTTTGVFNFAHGAVGMMAAYVYYSLRVSADLPTPVALFVVIGLFAPVVGLAIELVMRRFKDAPAGTTLVVTIALTILLIGLAQFLYPSTGAARNLPHLFGQRKVSILGAVISWDEAAWLVVAMAVAVSLRLLLFTSRTGTAMRAVVDNATLAGLNGAKPTVIARYSWMLGSVLAAIAGVLFAPTTGALEPIVLTFFVLNAYGAAVLGKMRSLPLTFAGAILLGIITEYAVFATPEGQIWNAVRVSIPGIFLFLALLLLPEAKLTVGRIVGRNAPRVPSLPSSVTRAGWFLAFVAVLANVGPQEYLPDMTRGLVYAVIVLSLVMLTGFSGQVSLAQYVFAALGAWAMGHYFGGSSIFGMALAALVAVPVGVIVALPAMRLQGLYLALVTFGFAAVSEQLVFENPHIFGEGNVEVGRLHLLGVNFAGDKMFFWLCGLVFAALSILVLALRRGAFGRRLAAMRDSQAACATLGLDVRRTKLTVFAISAAIAGVGGALFGGLNGTAGSIQFEKINNVVIFLFAVVGGITTITGALLGGALFALLPVVQSKAPDLAGLVFAGVAVAAISLGKQPNGIAGLLYERLPRLRAKVPTPAASTAEPREVANATA